MGKGIEQIRFGISRALLEKKLGTADKVDTDESGNPLLIYNRLQCTFWLNEDNELHWIQCSNSSARLWGEIVIGQPFAAQTEFLESLTEEIEDQEEHLIEGDYMLNEFVDRFGPRLAHLNGVLQVLAQLGSNATT